MPASLRGGGAGDVANDLLDAHKAGGGSTAEDRRAANKSSLKALRRVKPAIGDGGLGPPVQVRVIGLSGLVVPAFLSGLVGVISSPSRAA